MVRTTVVLAAACAVSTVATAAWPDDSTPPATPDKARHTSWARSSAAEMVRRSSALASAGRVAAALTACNEAIRMDPSYGAAYLALGQLRERMRDDREADLLYTRAVRLGDTAAEALARRARLRRRTGHAEEAFRDLEASVRLDLSNPKRIETLAGWYGERRAWVAALSLWRRLAQLGREGHRVDQARIRERIAHLLPLAADADPVTNVRRDHPSWVRRAMASAARRR